MFFGLTYVNLGNAKFVGFKILHNTRLKGLKFCGLKSVKINMPIEKNNNFAGIYINKIILQWL
jgi:hypothetical protein